MAEWIGAIVKPDHPADADTKAKIILVNFFREWRFASLNGPVGSAYPTSWELDPSMGLCGNLRILLDGIKTEGLTQKQRSELRHGARNKLRVMLSTDFPMSDDEMCSRYDEIFDAGHDPYPFGGEVVYNQQQRDKTAIYDNARLHWINKQRSLLQEELRPVLFKMFLKEYVAFLDNPTADRRYRSFGLCVLFDDYVEKLGVNGIYPNGYTYSLFNQEAYPFGGQSLYSQEYRKGIAYLNPMRRDWVKQQLENM